MTAPVQDTSSKVVYTAILGGVDTLLPPATVDEGWDYVCFSDEPIDCPPWRHAPIALQQPTLARESRYLKVNATTMLPAAEVSLWVDGNVQPMASAEALLANPRDRSVPPQAPIWHCTATRSGAACSTRPSPSSTRARTPRRPFSPRSSATRAPACRSTRACTPRPPFCAGTPRRCASWRRRGGGRSPPGAIGISSASPMPSGPTGCPPRGIEGDVWADFALPPSPARRSQRAQEDQAPRRKQADGGRPRSAPSRKSPTFRRALNEPVRANGQVRSYC